MHAGPAGRFRTLHRPIELTTSQWAPATPIASAKQRFSLAGQERDSAVVWEQDPEYARKAPQPNSACIVYCARGDTSEAHPGKCLLSCPPLLNPSSRLLLSLIPCFLVERLLLHLAFHAGTRLAATAHRLFRPVLCHLCRTVNGHKRTNA